MSEIDETNEYEKSCYQHRMKLESLIDRINQRLNAIEEKLDIDTDGNANYQWGGS